MDQLCFFAENELTKIRMTDDDHTNRRKHKERSILQTKLTKLAIQIGYVGMSSTISISV